MGNGLIVVLVFFAWISSLVFLYMWAIKDRDKETSAYISELSKMLGSSKASAETLRAELMKYKIDLARVNSECAELRQENKELKVSTPHDDAKDIDLRKQTESSLEELKRQLQKMRKERDLLEVENNAQRHRLIKIKEELFLLRAESKKVTNLQSNNSALQIRCDYLQGRIKELSGDYEDRITHLFEELNHVQQELSAHKQNLKSLLVSNISSMPWLAGMIADFITYDLEIEAKKLAWGQNVQRQKKVASIREIRAEATRRIEEAKIATYQLDYLLQLYPALSDILETDFSALELSGEIPDSDPVRGFLSDEEWTSLTENERNQLALDRYIQSHSKTKWQIGRDYELYIAHEFWQRGFDVDSCGSFYKLEDMGRDIVAKKEGRVYIVQCKYWAADKIIHEKHIYQLFGTAVSFSIENSCSHNSIIPVFVTSACLSPVARRAAEMLNVVVQEQFPLGEFPRIKCNIGHDENGKTFIFHLPMDDQYDKVKIDAPGECYAYTVAEAVSKGFRRAYKWHGN